MTLHAPVDLPALLPAVIAAVRDAGALLRAECLRADGPRGSDSHADIDEEIEALLRARLTGLLPALFRGEETGVQPAGPGGEGWCWLVDPHDGTSAFLQGHRGTAVSVALLRAGVPVLGVVYAPFSPDRGDDLIAWAEGAGPLTRNGMPVPTDLRDGTLRAGAIVFVSQDAPRKPATNATLCAPARWIALPGIAYRLARVAAGDGVAAVSLAHPVGHDLAAGHALLRGAGGVLLDERGREVTYTPDGRTAVRRCFGGAPRAARELAARDWHAVYEDREPRQAHRVPLRWPRAGDDTRIARATGVLFGQVIGDSLGSLVEFRSPTDIARSHPGGVRHLADGGTWNTLAGQPTDDSELALALARCLAAHGRHDEEAVARAYADWYASDPFDIGSTTRVALAARHRARLDDPAARLSEHAQFPAARDSQANGALMRASPIGIHAAGDPARAAALARRDARVTHPHAVCGEANAAFAAAIATGVAGADTADMLACARGVLGDDDAGRVIADTLARAVAGELPVAHSDQMGWVLIALQIAFRQLLHVDDVEAALVETVGLGGDTDTNAAITGALLGARHGRDAFPSRWVLPVIACRPLRGFAPNPRPAAYWPDDLPALAEGLLARGSTAR